MKKKTKMNNPAPTDKPAIALTDLLGEVRQRMRKARECYNLRCSNMSRVCGFGINQWRLYENGRAEPDRSNLHLIEIACRPKGFLQLLKLCSPLTRAEMGKRWQESYEEVNYIVEFIDKQGERLKQHLDETYFTK